MFHNTVAEKGEDHRLHRAMTFRQEDEVLDFFRSFPMFPFTAYDVQEALPSMLITSIRRSLTDLAKIGKLRKVDSVKGPYGVRVFRWRLA